MVDLFCYKKKLEYLNTYYKIVVHLFIGGAILFLFLGCRERNSWEPLALDYYRYLSK